MSSDLALVSTDLLILGGLSLLGGLVVIAILGRPDRFVLISLSFCVGAGLLSWSMFVASWAGLRLTAVTVIGIFAVLTVAAAFLALRGTRSKSGDYVGPESPRGVLDSWLTRGSWILIVTLILAAAFLAVGLSYFGWDDMSNWAVKGYGIALRGSIFAGREWGTNGLSYPMNITLLIAVFRLLDGNLLPGSKLLYPTFYGALLVGCYRFWVQQRLRRWAASLGVLLLATTPILFTHAYMGYTNVAFTAYLVLGLIWCLDSIGDNGARKAVLGGLLLSIALWTRPEGFVMSLAVLCALILGWMLQRQGSHHWLAVSIPLVVVGGTWLIFLRTQATTFGAAYDFFTLAREGILAGQIHWAAFSTILRFIAGQVLRFRDWGFLPLLAGLLCVLGFRPQRLRRDPVYTTLLFSMLMISLALIGLHYMAAYSQGGPSFVYEWLSLEFTRLAMPAGVGFALLGLLSLRVVEAERRDEAVG